MAMGEGEITELYEYRQAEWLEYADQELSESRQPMGFEAWEDQKAYDLEQEAEIEAVVKAQKKAEARERREVREIKKLREQLKAEQAAEGMSV
jgi:hypothetical protein